MNSPHLFEGEEFGPERRPPSGGPVVQRGVVPIVLAGVQVVEAHEAHLPEFPLLVVHRHRVDIPPSEVVAADTGHGTKKGILYGKGVASSSKERSL
jgi:hypothetical protein